MEPEEDEEEDYEADETWESDLDSEAEIAETVAQAGGGGANPSSVSVSVAALVRWREAFESARLDAQRVFGEARLPILFYELVVALSYPASAARPPSTTRSRWWGARAPTCSRTS